MSSITHTRAHGHKTRTHSHKNGAKISKRLTRVVHTTRVSVPKIKRETVHGMKKMLTWMNSNLKAGASATNGAIKKIPDFIVPLTVTVFSFLAMRSKLIKPTTAFAIALIEGGRQLRRLFQSPSKHRGTHKAKR